MPVARSGPVLPGSGTGPGDGGGKGGRIRVRPWRRRMDRVRYRRWVGWGRWDRLVPRQCLIINNNWAGYFLKLLHQNGCSSVLGWKPPNSFRCGETEREFVPRGPGDVFPRCHTDRLDAFQITRSLRGCQQVLMVEPCIRLCLRPTHEIWHQCSRPTVSAGLLANSPIAGSVRRGEKRRAGSDRKGSGPHIYG
ncbi:hypothetical protein JOF47_001735 [Paeniglutamicibacter kerguelensis]|uniref:IS110 family transposase n=1 Tax=Paeniglutamicibacter kerguelensis TaxID=254788 RepID=A0ABS4XCM4_9MICC|nr:hypothetical protein [Paeniglutamicibacter kerguelensis]